MTSVPDAMSAADAKRLLAAGGLAVVAALDAKALPDAFTTGQ